MSTTTTNTFIWNDVGQQLTCTPVHVTWNYAGNATTLDLSLTNIDVPQLAQPASSTAGSATTSTTANTLTDATVTTGTTGTTVAFADRAVPSAAGDISSQFQILVASSVTASEQSYDYSQIAAPQGWYQFIAASSAGDISKRTSSFYVWNGTDTSCIKSAIPSSTVSSTSAAGTSSETSSPGSTETASPSGSSSNNVGKIAGGVVGGVAGLGLLVFLLFFLRRRSNQQQVASSGATVASSGSRHHKGGRWGGLSSVDSITAAGAAHERQPSGGARSTHESKPKGFLNSLAMSDRGNHRSDAVSPYGAEEDTEKGSPTSPFTGEGDGPYEFTPEALGYQYSGSSSNLASRRPSAGTRHSTASSLSGGVPISANQSGRPSMSASPPASSLGHNPTPLSLAQPPVLGNIPMDSLYPSGVSNLMNDEYNPYDVNASPRPPQQPTSAQVSPAAATSPEKPKYKTSRKPVPSYTPSTISGLGFAPNPDLASPMPKSPSPASFMPSSSQGSGHYAVPNQPGSGLEHKNSFGKDGQVHYLIPDMPSSGS